MVGFYNWFQAGSGPTPPLPFLAGEDGLISALSVGLFVVMWNYMGWELPSAAGDEIVNPRKTYPLRHGAHAGRRHRSPTRLPLVAGLYGGAADDGRYAIWGIEEYEEGEGIGVVAADYGVTEEQMLSWGVDPASPVGWEFPDIAHRLGEVAAGENSGLARFLGITVTLSAVLSMIGLFIGNSLGGTRVPFALAEDGMMPKWLVRVHPRYGTPWVAILLCAVIYTIFSLQAFAFAGRHGRIPANAGHPDGVRGAMEIPSNHARRTAYTSTGWHPRPDPGHAWPRSHHPARDLQSDFRGGHEFARSGAGRNRRRRGAVCSNPRPHQTRHS